MFRHSLVQSMSCGCIATLVSLKGTVASSLHLNSTLLYGIVSLDNMVYVSAHEDYGGIYKIIFDDDNCGLAEKVLSNGNSPSTNVGSLVDYLEHLHLFGETIGLHTKKSTSVKVGISQAIKKLERVYSFDKKCVDAVTNLIGTTAVTQGPQETVSSVVMEDE